MRALLGILPKSDGRLIYGESDSNPGHPISIGYSAQVAWIQNATLMNNVLFATTDAKIKNSSIDEEDFEPIKTYNKRLYRKVLKACALIDDLKVLPGGDKTEIGEKGINLSGGQKQRISLARAVYSQADVYIFDDPLSAVDSHVANHIFNECFLKMLSNKTIILATHAVSFLRYAHQIIVVEDGRIKMIGNLQELKDANINLTKFIIEKKTDTDDEVLFHLFYIKFCLFSEKYF